MECEDAWLYVLPVLPGMVVWPAYPAPHAADAHVCKASLTLARVKSVGSISILDVTGFIGGRTVGHFI
jgi:hypothetical protein